MSPGATWQPFVLEEQEYAELVAEIKTAPISEIESFARFAYVPFIFDDEFDQVSDQFEWMIAVCEKHRDAWHSELRKAGRLAG